jgi:lipopolysaccharide biosynthesis glycosyltransferase
MKNAIVYSFHIRNKNLKDNRCYKQLRYSLNTLRNFNQQIPVYVYISPSTIDTDSLNLGENTFIIKFDIEDNGGWPKEWVDLGYLEFLKHRWEKAIECIELNYLDNILYLDTDTIFHNDPEILFKKYGSTTSLWAKPDNSNELMKKVEVWPGMNDGQFILSKDLATKEILSHMKFYVNHTLSHNKEKLTREEYLNLSWVSTSTLFGIIFKIITTL